MGEGTRTWTTDPAISADACPQFLQFVHGDPRAVAAAAAVIERVVRFRGYYVPRDERPDIVQEAMVDVVRAARESSFESDDAFHRFVRTVAYRRCIDWVRRATRREPLDPRVQQVLQPEDNLLARERRTLATNVVQKLKRPCRDLIALRLVRGLDYGELSRILGRSEGALRTQSSYCLRQARRLMDRFGRGGKLVKLDDWRER